MTFKFSENPSASCDAYLIDADLVATADFISVRGSVSCDVWFSGRTEANGLVALLRVQVSLGAVSETKALAELNGLHKAHLHNLAEASRLAGGIINTQNTYATKDRERLCSAHLDLHAKTGSIGESLGIKQDIAYQFQLLKSLGLASAKPFLAQRLGLPLSTITRRIWMAQEIGLLPKVSAEPDIKEEA
jgi:predicted transcriptional regulator